MELMGSGKKKSGKTKPPDTSVPGGKKPKIN